MKMIDDVFKFTISIQPDDVGFSPFAECFGFFVSHFLNDKFVLMIVPRDIQPGTYFTCNKVIRNPLECSYCILEKESLCFAL